MTLKERFMHLFRRGQIQPNDDFISASIQANADEHSRLVGALHAALRRRAKTNEALRESIRIAEKRTNSFADFERMAIRREEMK